MLTRCRAIKSPETRWIRVEWGQRLVLRRLGADQVSSAPHRLWSCPIPTSLADYLRTEGSVWLLAMGSGLPPSAAPFARNHRLHTFLPATHHPHDLPTIADAAATTVFVVVDNDLDDDEPLEATETPTHPNLPFPCSEHPHHVHTSVDGVPERVVDVGATS
uniref:Uncharacterized protein n=1 Tax=Mycena chlorophos TaxID=658473 RepID=A0ABQ0L3V2_MYCCL|nr:predicted protein [Mycena chlorophos]